MHLVPRKKRGPGRGETTKVMKKIKLFANEVYRILNRNGIVQSTTPIE